MFEPELYPVKDWRRIDVDELDIVLPGFQVALRISNMCEFEVERDGTVRSVRIRSPFKHTYAAFGPLKEPVCYFQDDETRPERAAIFKAFARALPNSLGDRWIDILEDAFK